MWKTSTFKIWKISNSKGDNIGVFWFSFSEPLPLQSAQQATWAPTRSSFSAPNRDGNVSGMTNFSDVIILNLISPYFHYDNDYLKIKDMMVWEISNTGKGSKGHHTTTIYFIFHVWWRCIFFSSIKNPGAIGSTYQPSLFENSSKRRGQ